MATTPVNVSASSLRLDLSATGLAALGFAALVAGDDYYLRALVLSADGLSTVDLTGAVVILTAARKNADGSQVFVRHSGTVIAGTATQQIALDNQGVDNGPSGSAGKGWFQINWSSAASDHALMMASIGTHNFDVRIKFASGTVQTYLRGTLQVLLPSTDPVA